MVGGGVGTVLHTENSVLFVRSLCKKTFKHESAYAIRSLVCLTTPSSKHTAAQNKDRPMIEYTCSGLKHTGGRVTVSDGVPAEQG